MNRSTLRNTIFSLLILLAAVAAFSFSAYFIKHKEQVLHGQIETLAKERQQDRFYADLQNVYEDSQEKRTALDTHLLMNEGSSIDILTWIEGQAPGAGVSLETNNLQKITDKETKSDWVEVSFTFSGERANVERFISVLERLPYVSHLTSLSFGARASNNWEATATVRILLFKPS